MKPGTTVAEIGEFALIDRLKAALPREVSAFSGDGLGIGDDAALWSPPSGEDLVITTDALIEGIHFRLDWTDWESLGHKMLAVNISDIAAMGATPRLATIVLGLGGDESVADIEALYVGAGRLAAAHSVIIAGGDVVRSPHGVMLSVTLIGSVVRGQAIARSGARPGDLVVVSGTLGASAAGMHLIADGNDTSASGPLLRAAHLRPNPRVALGRLLREGGVTAAMDLSDGLLGDLPKVLAASGVSARIDADLVPVMPAVRALFPDRWQEFALRGGEDYELLMTVPRDRFDRFLQTAAGIGATLTAIGEIVAGNPGDFAMVSEREYGPIETGAWDHFASARYVH